VAVVESLVHYADNTLRYDDYTVDDPSVLGGLVMQWAVVASTGTSSPSSSVPFC
jgi:hypothetical protein